ncbi:MAG TPA: hypothetical protein VLQ20_07125 [Planococcus sp. (in: firmicutes)]|nr:hypothetical protein [Planococcus sp. (in: firmicutes)]
MEKVNETDLSQTTPEKPVVADHRLGMTLFLFSIIMVFVSFVPEKTVLAWLIINSIFIIIFLGILYFLWTKYKHDTVRYYSFQVYIMLMGIAFFSIPPIFKLLFGTMYFWILLAATLALSISSHLFKKRTVKSFVNKNHKLLGTILSLYTMVLIVVGIFLIGMMQRNEAPENTGVALLFYFVSAMFLVLAPMFLVREEDVEKLKS